MAKKNKKTGSFIGKFLGVSALVVLIAVGVQSGSMKGLNGRSLVDIEPAAGEVGEKSENEGGHSHSHDGDDGYYDVPIEPTECGIYEHWISHSVDEEAIKETGKVYRIIGLGDAVTMDYNPERINVYLNQDDLILDVRCG